MTSDPDLPPERSRQFSSSLTPNASSRPRKADVRIVPAMEGDISRLAKIYMKAYRGMEQYGEASTDQAASYLLGLFRLCSRQVFKATVNGRLAGMIACDPDWSEPGQGKVLEVHELVIDPDCQGYGLGSRLMRFAAGLGRKFGRSRVSLWAGEGNTRAIGWYRNKFGFQRDRKSGIWVHFQAPVEQIGHS